MLLIMVVGYCGAQMIAYADHAHSHQHGEIKVVPTSSTAVSFRGLLQIYEFEFLPYTNKEVNNDGWYDEDVRSAYGADRYLLYCGMTPVGFAVINLSSMITGDPAVRDVGDFFIIPSHRKFGLGKQFAHELFTRYAGLWEIRQLSNLQYARSFWRKTIAAYVGDNFTDSDINSHLWVGSVQSFSVNT